MATATTTAGAAPAPAMPAVPTTISTRRLIAWPEPKILVVSYRCVAIACATLSGARNVRIVQTDLRKPLPFSRPFDCVLVDAPCSGLGTLRRDPDIRWRRRESDLPALAAAELTMLRHAADGVAPGGRLVYATCSSEPEENEQVVDAFSAAAPDFVPVAATAASVRILNLDQIEIFFPIRTFLIERRIAVTDFDPLHASIVKLPSLIHVSLVLVAGNRSTSERAIFDCALKRLFLAFFDSRCDEIPHV